MKVMVFDVGGTEIKYSVMDEAMRRMHTGSVPTPQDTQAHFLDALYQLYLPHKDEVPAEVTELVEKRAAAKKAKDWATADAIRAQLTELGWAVKDTAQGPQLSKL